MFANVFTLSPVGPLQPNGKQVEWEIMNLFRYDGEGRLAEECTDLRSGVKRRSPTSTDCEG
jgi:hypothetical protein